MAGRMSEWGLIATKWECYLPETEKVMGGTQKRMKGGVWQTGERLYTNGGRGRREK